MALPIPWLAPDTSAALSVSCIASPLHRRLRIGPRPVRAWPGRTTRRLPLTAGHEAAIDVDHLAGGEAAGRRGEIDREPDEVFRKPQAAGRSPVGDPSG